MRRIIKKEDSKILKEGLVYKVNGDNKKLARYLLEEQKNICAYTEIHLGRAEVNEIDHFNPTLKGTKEDGYNNYFLISGQWNREKSNKWEDFQPIMHPTDKKLEERIVYFDGDYLVKDIKDKEAKNLYNLLNIGDPDLAKERKDYIKRKKEELGNFKQTPNDFFRLLFSTEPNGVKFIRAIQEEFNIIIDL